jgi:type IV pilus assembly protein PilA
MFHPMLGSHSDDHPAVLDAAIASEGGFTLIELMVVLLIIAILLAIAIPTFLGVTSSANDRAAQSNLTNGLTEATAQYQANAQSYASVSTALVSSAPEFTWTAATSTCSTAKPNCISIEPIDLATAADAQGVIIAAMSKTGTCWFVAQLQSDPIVLASDTGGTLAFMSTTWAASETSGMQGYTQGTTTAALTAAGTYYAKLQTSPTKCFASYPVTTGSSGPGGWNWGSSYSNAPNA